MSDEKGNEEEVASPWKGPSSASDPKARRWMSSRAASILDDHSLLDDHDEEEEDVVLEPGLMSMTESISEETRGDAAVIENQNNHGTVDSIVRLTEGMSGLLCSSSIEGVDAVVAVQLKKHHRRMSSGAELKTHHRRMSSETDFLQRRLASSNCGTTTFCLPSKESAVLTREAESSSGESSSVLERADTLRNSRESLLDDSHSMLERTDTLKKIDPHSVQTSIYSNCAQWWRMTSYLF